MKKWGGVKWPTTGLTLISLILSILPIQPAQAADCATTTSSSGSTRFVKITSASGCTWLIPSGVTSLDFVLVGGGGGGWKSDSAEADRAGKNGAAGIILIRYTVPADTTPPTFISSSFSAAENIATSAAAATIRVSESATVTISSGADAARFNISRTDTDTAIIKFNVSPDFEAPIDSGGNNVYDLTLTATDTVGNAGTQAITITVTDVVDTSAFNSFALAGSVTTATFRITIQITANVTVAAKITFRANNNRIPGCINVRTTGTSPNIVAVCNWKPSRRGPLTLTAAATPTGAGISSASATPIRVLVGNRTGLR
jgi:hypothetical protein